MAPCRDSPCRNGNPKAVTSAPEVNSKSRGTASAFLWVKIYFIKQGRTEKIRDADLEPLAKFMDDPQLDGSIAAGNQIMNGGLGNAAQHEQLILGHISFFQKLRKPQTDSLIQLQEDHHPFHNFTLIICGNGEIIVHVAELKLAFCREPCYNAFINPTYRKRCNLWLVPGLKNMLQKTA